jgi:hypothetical protein
MTTSDFLAYGPQISVLSPGTPLAIPAFPMTSPAYLISADLETSAPATVPCMGLKMAWEDPDSGALLDQETWYMQASSNALGSLSATVAGRGPCKSGQLAITLTDYDPAETISVNLAVYQSTRFITRDDWRHLGLSSIPTFTAPTVDPTNGILGYHAAAALGAGGSLTRLCCLYSGQAQLMVTNPATQSLTVQVNTLDPVLGVPNFVPLWLDTSAAAQVVVDVTLARGPAQVIVANNGSSSTPMAFSLVQQEFAS